MKKQIDVLTWKGLFSVMPYMQVEEGKEPWKVFGGAETDWQIMFENVMVRGVGKDAAISTEKKGNDDAYLVKHTHTRGTMNITGNFGCDVPSNHSQYCTGAFEGSNVGNVPQSPERSDLKQPGICYGYGINASKAWTGATSEEGDLDSSAKAGRNIPAYKEVKFWRYIGFLGGGGRK